jgi:pimeloyl-ACP methyl ester carboxylesterase
MIAFVHGVPETATIWDEVRSAIGHESVALSLPGFGSERPDGFGATKDDYVDWLLGEVDRLDGPVDLVGHDWGAGLTLRVATAHGDRLRSWALDCANIVHPDYEWHGIAKIWQTPGEGEAFVASQTSMAPEELAAGLEGLGVPGPAALGMAATYDATMGACILDLYRSATPNIDHDWGPLAPVAVPGLVVHASDDPFGDEDLARGAADTLGARFELLEGVGHFWPYQAPGEGAAVLTDFWDSLG